jgi:flap endonuclease-1
MGVSGLSDLAVHKPFAPPRNPFVAVDAPNLLHTGLHGMRGRDGGPMTGPGGELTGHIAGVLRRHDHLLRQGFIPVYVFESGQPHPLKAEEAKRRREARESRQKATDKAYAEGRAEDAKRFQMQALHMTSAMYQDARQLMPRLGMAVLDAPGEAEAECARLGRDALVGFTCSQDYDTLLFGAPAVVRDLQPYKDAQLVSLPDTLANLKISHAQLVDVALLSGTDFNAGVSGVGVKKALKLIQAHGAIEAILDGAGSGAAESAVRASWTGDVAELRRIFLEPTVNSGPLSPPRQAEADAVADLVHYGLNAREYAFLDGATGTATLASVGVRQATLAF